MRRKKAVRLFLLCAAILGVTVFAGRGLLRPNPYAPTQNGFTLTRQWNEEPPYSTMPMRPYVSGRATLRWEPVGIGPLRDICLLPRLTTTPPQYGMQTDPGADRSRAPWYPALQIGLPPERASAGFAWRTLRADAVSSTGDTFPLAVAGDQFQPISPSVFVSLPTVGIPATYRWIDVTLRRRDTDQVCGTWRVFDLPRLRHTRRPDPIERQSLLVSVSGAPRGKGIQVEARAWQAAPRRDVNRPDAGRYTLYPFERPVEAELHAEADPTLFHSPYETWAVRIKALIPEWDAPNRLASGEFDPHDPAASVFRAGTVSMQATGNSAYATAQFAAAPNPTVQHAAYINAELVHCDRLVEDATFSDLSFLMLPDGHIVFNLPQGVKTITTPSGVRVTLRALPILDDFWWHSPVNHEGKTVEVPYSITVQPAPTARFDDLPRGPLSQKNGPPVKISVSLTPNSSKSEVVVHGWSTGYQNDPPIPTRERGGFLINTDDLQKRLTFGVRVKQERVHETVSFGLVVPVDTKPPARRGR